MPESRADGPERAPYLREVLGGTRGSAEKRVAQVSRSARDARDQQRQTRRPELGGSPWLEGGSERGAKGGGGSRARTKRGGKGRVQAARKRGGVEGSAAEATPSALRCAEPRPSHRPDSSLPGRGWRARLRTPPPQARNFAEGGLPAPRIPGRDRRIHAPLLTPLPPPLRSPTTLPFKYKTVLF